MNLIGYMNFVTNWKSNIHIKFLCSNLLGACYVSLFFVYNKKAFSFCFHLNNVKILFL